MSEYSDPSVEMDFLLSVIIPNPSLEAHKTQGSTTIFISKGEKALHRRTLLVRELDPGCACFNQAMALAVRFNFLGQLLKWLEENRNWKEGAYFED